MPVTLRVCSALLWLAVAGEAAAQPGDARAVDAYRRAADLEARGDTSGALALLWTASGLAPRDADI